MTGHPDSRPKPYRRQMRVSLQVKAALVITFMVVSVALVGGWFYFGAAKRWLSDSDRQYAFWSGRQMVMAAQEALQSGRYDQVHRTADLYFSQANIQFVMVLNAKGEVVACSPTAAEALRWAPLTRLAKSISAVVDLGQDHIGVAQPIREILPSGQEGDQIGALRMVINTSAMRSSFARVQDRLSSMAAALVLVAIPVGYLLVWRILVQPIRRLVGVTRQLAGGDFDARAHLASNDEIGELSEAFDTMAEHVASMQNALIAANEQLEEKVCQRTEALSEANGRLRSEMAEKEDFLRAVSHDLNAPLRNIAGMTAMLTMKWGQTLPEEVLARLQRIQSNVDTGSGLIGELLELSRVQRRPQTRQIVNMQVLIESVGGMLDFELKKRGITLTVHGPMPTLYVEKSRLHQVFQNFIDNAIKYMHRPQGGHIDIRYELLDGKRVFSVSDDGPGIPQDQLEKIFYVFRRLESAQTAKVPGHGVGLAMVKSIAGTYGGRAWAESKVGAGSTFFISLSAECTEVPSGPLSGRPDGEERQEKAHVATEYSIAGG
jgi:signal transduction histidine kinase